MAPGRRNRQDQDPGRSAHPADDLGLAEQLPRAIHAGELRLWFQPIVALVDDEVVGVEALVRWQHPEHGLLAPAAFIPEAEQSDLIVEVGRWVLDAACRQAAEWRQRGRRLQVSVNVGAHHVEHPEFVRDVLGALERHHLDPSALCLEITEAVPMDASEAALARLGDLRRRGVRIALDDFGTGCSSLATVVRVEIDELKVDRMFVAGLQSDDRANHALVTAVLGLASTLGLDVVAEGIETAAQLRELRALGCPFGQGYLYQRPLPPAELEAWIHERTLARRAQAAPTTMPAARRLPRRGGGAGSPSLRFESRVASPSVA
jgi:EAL domain-containing protein (putative c-di-GMP-specific phosphodiesterase class I)